MKDYAEAIARHHRIFVQMCDALEQKRLDDAMRLDLELIRGGIDISFWIMEQKRKQDETPK